MADYWVIKCVMTGWQVMHLLKIDESGALYDSDEAVDLGQPAGDVVISTSADTEVLSLIHI
mgnify:CR=1 FL=1